MLRVEKSLFWKVSLFYFPFHCEVYMFTYVCLGYALHLMGNIIFLILLPINVLLNLDRGLHITLHDLLLESINYIFYSFNTEYEIHMSIEKLCEVCRVGNITVENIKVEKVKRLSWGHLKQTKTNPIESYPPDNTVCSHSKHFPPGLDICLFKNPKV